MLLRFHFEPRKIFESRFAPFQSNDLPWSIYQIDQSKDEFNNQLQQSAVMRAKDEILHLNDFETTGIPRKVSENRILEVIEIARHFSCDLFAASVAAFASHHDVCFVVIVAFSRNERMIREIWNEISHSKLDLNAHVEVDGITVTFVHTRFLVGKSGMINC